MMNVCAALILLFVVVYLGFGGELDFEQRGEVGREWERCCGEP